MQKDIKLLAGSTVIYGLASILQKGLVFFLLPVYTNYFTTSEYGIISLIGLFTTGLSPFFNLGTGNSIGILFFKSECYNEKASIIWSSFLLLILHTTILVILIVIFEKKVSLLFFSDTKFGLLIILSTITLQLSSLSDPFFSYLRMTNKEKKFVILTTIDCVLTISLTILMIVVLKKGIMGFFIASLVSKMLTALMTISVVGLKLPFSINLKFWKPLVSIGFPSVFGLFAFMLIDLIDRKLIFSFLGSEATGVYAFGYNLGMIMIIIVNAFNAGWAPFFMSYVRRQIEAVSIFGKVLKYYIMVFCLAIIFFFFGAKFLVMLVGTDQYMGAYKIIGIIAASYMFKGCYVIFLPGIYFSEKTYIQSCIEWLAAIINISLNFILISEFGIGGAAIATLLSYLSLAIMSFFFSKKFLKVKYEWRSIFTVLFFTTFSAVSFYYLYDLASNMILIAVGFFFIMMYITMCFHLLDVNEKAFFLKKIRIYQTKLGF